MRGFRRRLIQAYTITEMLVVLGIIILVATMALPAVVPMMRGRALRSSASILQAALMNVKQYAVQERSDQPCYLFQATDLARISSALVNYSRVQTYGREGTVKATSLSALPKFIQVWPYKWDVGGSDPTSLPSSGGRYLLGTFRADGSTTLSSTAAVTRIYIVDLRTVADPTQWSDDDYIGDWNDLVVEVNNITGRVRVIDPDLP